jgi:hypothetical protein
MPHGTENTPTPECAGLAEALSRFKPAMAPFAISAMLLAIALAAVSEASAQPSAGTGEPSTENTATAPKLTIPRYDEDYSYLRDPANRTGAWWERFNTSRSIQLGTSPD